ncbi:MAG: hypothetical protein M1541_16465, partial [Acidobacteria bacterium]|nr:hypothetical protein [Acidobacteriota bacterium]
MEHIEIAAAAGRCAYVEPGIEAPDPIENAAPESHIRPDAQILGGHRPSRADGVAAKAPRGEAFSHPAIALK